MDLRDVPTATLVQQIRDCRNELRDRGLDGDGFAFGVKDAGGPLAVHSGDSNQDWPELD